MSTTPCILQCGRSFDATTDDVTSVIELGKISRKRLCCGVVLTSLVTSPMAHSYRLGLVTWGYEVRIPVGMDICHRGCAYKVLQIVQRHGVYSAVYGTVHYTEPLKSFEIRVGHSPGFGLPSVAILS